MKAVLRTIWTLAVAAWYMSGGMARADWASVSSESVTTGTTRTIYRHEWTGTATDTTPFNGNVCTSGIEARFDPSTGNTNEDATVEMRACESDTMTWQQCRPVNFEGTDGVSWYGINAPANEKYVLAHATADTQGGDTARVEIRCLEVDDELAVGTSTVSPHATTHSSGQSDPISLQNLAGAVTESQAPMAGASRILDQTAGETDLRYDATQEAYFHDTDGDGSRDTDGTEPYADMGVVEVPQDYATVQLAIDSNDCKKGSGTANQGCAIRVSPGTYAQVFEVGGTTLPDTQYSILIEGTGPAGTENSVGGQTCGVTFTGNNVANHNIVTVEGTIGLILRNFCIDMDESATNDALNGIAIAPVGGQPIRHVTLEHITIEDGVVASGSGVYIGPGSSSDVSKVLLHKLRIANVVTCITHNNLQAVEIAVDAVECADPTGTIGGISIGSNGGGTWVHDLYFSPGAANQIGINIRNEAMGALVMDEMTFEWDQDNGTFINFQDPGTNDGAYRSTTIRNSRFIPQTIASTRHVCVDWNRQGSLIIQGNSFESAASSSRTCEFDFNNTSATKAADIYFFGNDIQWDGTQSDPAVTRTTDGGAIRVVAFDDGEVATCSGAGSGIAATSTGCYGQTPSGFEGGSASHNFSSARLRTPTGTAFPSSPSSNEIFVVTDDSAVGACDSAAGSAQTFCRWNGANWVSLGDGGSGGGGGDSIAVEGAAVADASGVDLIGGTTGIDITLNTAVSPDTATWGVDLTELTCGVGLLCSSATAFSVDTTEIGATTWGSGSGFAWTFNAGATDPVLTFGSGTLAITGLTTLTLPAASTLAITSGCSLSTTLDCAANSTTGGAMTLREDSDLGTDTWTIALGATNLAAPFSITPNTAGLLNIATLLEGSSANLRTALSDESGTGAAVFSGGDVGAATATTPAADDNDTSVGTTAYVQTELSAYGGDTKTLTNTTLDVEATGNVMTVVERRWYQAAVCDATVAYTLLDNFVTSDPLSSCISGSNTTKGVLDHDDTVDEGTQITDALATDWTGAIDVRIKWLAAATTGNVVWGVQVVCVADGETDDPAFLTAGTATDAAKGTTNQTNDASITGLTTTGCAAGELMHVRVFRDADNASDTMTGDARLIGYEITKRRAM